IIPTLRPRHRAGPGRPTQVTDAELVCLAAAQVLLRSPDEHNSGRAPPLGGPRVVAGRARTPAKRSGLAGWAGYGHDTSHHCCYWGSRLLLVTTPEGTVTGFGLANPKLLGERDTVLAMLEAVPANRPAPGTLLVGDKGFAGRDFQTPLAGWELGILRPARA